MRELIGDGPRRFEGVFILRRRINSTVHAYRIEAVSWVAVQTVIFGFGGTVCEGQMVLVGDGHALDARVPDHRRHDLAAFVAIDFVAQVIEPVSYEIFLCLTEGIAWSRHGIIERGHGLGGGDLAEEGHGCSSSVEAQIDVHRLVHLPNPLSFVDRRKLFL